ncbi:hypothetical protein PENVUL_c010G03273 [Penicillium vulpinum]|uniref:F-box domain-containing protein n=1 Tax=Penicillium vulpinum TaxID=29845 RepID=A0A1V6S2I2_9EURO|nr:hypothetical protein PENVUL_c010G03273 [Penicillium vulpinum]
MAAINGPNKQQSDKGPNDQPVDDRQPSPPAGQFSFIEKLPAEIIQDIASYLSASDLACLGATSRTLFEHGSTEFLWANLVNARLPTPIQDPGPFQSFRRLYLAFYPCWFIPQYKIWFGDNDHTGVLILARYDNHRGVIKGYRIVAERGLPEFQIWMSNPEVMIHCFDPSVHLALDDPVLLINDPDPTSPTAPIQSFKSIPEERRMPVASDSRHIYTSLSFCCEFTSQAPLVRPNVIWPPQTIPSKARTLRDLRNSPSLNVKHLSELSESLFRVRKWANPGLTLSPVPHKASVTYSTLDPVLYTPTPEKPYQGIWVGDYKAHGCEFLLFLQRDRVSPLHGRRSSKIIDTQEEIRHRGPLEGIKLTGDSNVPRGQLSFIADDLGSRGLINIGTDEPFVGARIVRCRGHVAGLGFLDGKWPH